MFLSCATPLLLAIILARANAYLRALATLHLSGTVYKLWTLGSTVLYDTELHKLELSYKEANKKLSNTSGYLIPNSDKDE